MTSPFPTSRMQCARDISSVVDGFFFGFIVSAVLLGITIVQGWIYAYHNHDKWPVRSFVTLIVLLDITDTCCSALLLRYYLVKHFGNFAGLRLSPPLVSADFAVTGTITFLVHLFFASRLLLLGRNWWFPGLILICSVAMMGIGIAALVLKGRSELLVEFRAVQLKIEMTTFHILGILTDILVTIGLSVMLSPGKMERTSTKAIFHRLLMYTVTRGILIVLVQIGHVTMYLVNPLNLHFWITLHLALSKVYVITTLVILNSRPSAQRDTSDDDNNLTIVGLSFTRSASLHSNDEADLKLPENAHTTC